MVLSIAMKHNLFVCTVKWSNRFIWLIDRTLSSITTPRLREPGSNGIEEVLYISQSSSTGSSPLDSLVSYPGYLLWGGVLPLCSDAVGVFNSPSRLGCIAVETELSKPIIHHVFLFSFFLFFFFFFFFLQGCLVKDSSSATVWKYKKGVWNESRYMPSNFSTWEINETHWHSINTCWTFR